MKQSDLGLPVCYSDKQFEPSSPENQHFICSVRNFRAFTVAVFVFDSDQRACNFSEQLFKEQLFSETVAWHITVNVFNYNYSKTCVKRPLSKKTKNCFSKTIYRLMQVKSITECSKGRILQFFRLSLSYHLSLRSLVCLFLSGCFTLLSF